MESKLKCVFDVDPEMLQVCCVICLPRLLDTCCVSATTCSVILSNTLQTISLSQL